MHEALTEGRGACHSCLGEGGHLLRATRETCQLGQQLRRRERAVEVESDVCDLGCGARGGEVEGAVRSAPPRDEVREELTA